jgi:hypothetical protein
MPDFPSFKNEMLSGVVQALRERSKAISYQSRGSGWTVSCEIEADGSERIDLDIAVIGNCKTRLSMWSDNTLWYRACRGTAKNGWDFLLTFYGTTNSISSDTVVDQLICSLVADESELLRIWENVEPEIECHESK